MLPERVSMSVRKWSRFIALKFQGWHTSRWSDVYQFPHRLEGYRFLWGKGLEIGALNCPATLPPNCDVTYADVWTQAQAQESFSEVPATRFVKIDRLLNLNTPLPADLKASQDFVILNHVLEHVANPILTLVSVSDMLRPNGKLVLSIPDKNYTFDKPRNLTTVEHLFEEFKNNTREVSDDHYFDFVKAVYPHIFNDSLPHSDWLSHPLFLQAKHRAEHAHVWDSQSFEHFLMTVFNHTIQRRLSRLYCSKGPDNQYEYFSVWSLE